jgi:hypothetical protein
MRGATDMSADLLYCRGDHTALITPDALRIRFKQPSFPVIAQQRATGSVLLIGQDAELSLTELAGYVESVAVHAKFVGKGSRMWRVCELLESMGWVRAEGF